MAIRLPIVGRPTGTAGGRADETPAFLDKVSVFRVGPSSTNGFS